MSGRRSFLPFPAEVPGEVAGGGTTGATGPAGGPTGATGAAGTTGATGVSGATGAGTTGATGVGTTGATGVGTTGATGVPGATGSVGPLGAFGTVIDGSELAVANGAAIVFDTAPFGPDNAITPTVNGFTIVNTGDYHYDFYVRGVPASGGIIGFAVGVNGSAPSDAELFFSDPVADATPCFVFGSGIISLTSGDTVTLINGTSVSVTLAHPSIVVGSSRVVDASFTLTQIVPGGSVGTTGATGPAGGPTGATGAAGTTGATGASGAVGAFISSTWNDAGAIAIPNSGAGPATLITTTVTPPVLAEFIITSSIVVVCAIGGTVNLQNVVDGTPVGPTWTELFATSEEKTVSMVYKTNGFAAGAHTVAIQGEFTPGGSSNGTARLISTVIEVVTA